MSAREQTDTQSNTFVFDTTIAGLCYMHFTTTTVLRRAVDFSLRILECIFASAYCLSRHVEDKLVTLSLN